MDHREVGRFWEENAEAWTALSRAGYDVFRDYLNTPAFMEMLPSVDRLAGLDIGCGEGTNTRTVAESGARMTAIDIAPTFIERAKEEERKSPLGTTRVYPVLLHVRGRKSQGGRSPLGTSSVTRAFGVLGQQSGHERARPGRRSVSSHDVLHLTWTRFDATGSRAGS
jgi:SAM-dependent methyltransferase